MNIACTQKAHGCNKLSNWYQFRNHAHCTITLAHCPEGSRLTPIFGLPEYCVNCLAPGNLKAVAGLLMRSISFAEYQCNWHSGCRLVLCYFNAEETVILMSSLTTLLAVSYSGQMWCMQIQASLCSSWFWWRDKARSCSTGNRLKLPRTSAGESSQRRT